MRFLKSALFTAAILAFAVPAVSYAQPHHHPGPVHSMRVDIHAAKAAVANAPFSDSKRAVDVILSEVERKRNGVEESICSTLFIRVFAVRRSLELLDCLGKICNNKDKPK